ncbi:MAG: 3-phosphoshikimate 1-carboxyvinyltransferase, partial [Saprospiraceae bacterium]
SLIIRALCEEDFEIKNLSSAKDTQTLIELLNSKEEILDAGPAGTTFRFMTAYLSLQEGTKILTGSERMKQRPIAVLVDALRKLGANIEYLENEGYPPLKIHSPKSLGEISEITMAADISSQYISALLMVAPTLPKGLKINFKGQPVSLPYIRMTLRMMAFFGIEYKEEEMSIQVLSGKYKARTFKVEADWSAASYYCSLAALANEADVQVNGLFEESHQGDSVIAEIGKHFGLQTEFNEKGIRITKEKKNISHFVWNFTECPDIAQTVAVMCAGFGVSAEFSGLKTLRIKETDRISALRIELEKVGIQVEELGDEGMKIQGETQFDTPCFATYDDHRMAMAFAPFALMGKIEIEEPEVVVKSYPEYWEDLRILGFVLT